MSYLRAMIEPGHACGLDGDLAHPELAGWHERAAALAATTARMRPGSLVAGVHASSGLPCLVENGGGGRARTMLVIHPLWKRDGPEGEALARSDDVLFVDTFELERRPLRALEDARRAA
ncbi:hypothetical protein QP166_05035 [Sphingomonas sp. LR60]|uniref:hypothetical protein n=1 Tax=Sphingomonas sp. LR60 TaxID=3050233 RepID=UPI002FE0C204